MVAPYLESQPRTLAFDDGLSTVAFAVLCLLAIHAVVLHALPACRL